MRVHVIWRRPSLGGVVVVVGGFWLSGGFAGDGDGRAETFVLRGWVGSVDGLCSLIVLCAV